LAKGDLMFNKLVISVLVVLTGFGSSFAQTTPALSNLPQHYKSLDDAAVDQAKKWQAGGKSHALISSDGKVVFAFGQTMPRLTCSPTRACDVELEPGEKAKKIIIGDGVNWQWDAAESIERGKVIQHVIIQPKDKDLETHAIFTTDRRTYHIKLYSPKVEGAYINRAGFYYPADLVSSWEDKITRDSMENEKSIGANVLPTPVSPLKLAFDYDVFGDADFRPLHIFNDGERVYMEMPFNLNTGENPVFLLIDEDGKEMVVNYRREIDSVTRVIHYVVDKLFSHGELRMGTQKVEIKWKRKQKTFWPRFGNN
jgi:P-type conjugative transfer protein TrbG